jgi:hypothetical protein
MAIRLPFLSFFLSFFLPGGIDVANLRLVPIFTLQENSWYSFLSEAELTRGLIAALSTRPPSRL